MFVLVKAMPDAQGRRAIHDASHFDKWRAGDKALPTWADVVEVPGEAETYPWPLDSPGAAMLDADSTIIQNPAVVPVTDEDRFDLERWVKATNLYWQGVIAQLVAGLNQVRTNPTTPFAAVSAPTIAEVRAGVVAKYRMPS